MNLRIPLIFIVENDAVLILILEIYKSTFLTLAQHQPVKENRESVNTKNSKKNENLEQRSKFNGTVHPHIF